MSERDAVVFEITRRWIRQVREEQHLRAEGIAGHVIRKTDAEPTAIEVWDKIKEVEKELDNCGGL